MQKILHAKKKKPPTKQDIYLLKTYFCTFLQAEPQSRIWIIAVVTFSKVNLNPVHLYKCIKH